MKNISELCLFPENPNFFVLTVTLTKQNWTSINESHVALILLHALQIASCIRAKLVHFKINLFSNDNQIMFLITDLEWDFEYCPFDQWIYNI